MNSEPVLLIGCGNMGGAILRGLEAGRALAPRSVTVIDPRRPAFAGATVLPDVDALAEFSEGVILLAVKPALIAPMLVSLKRFAGSTTVFVSIAAGIGVGALQEGLGEKASIVRAMPNTPAAVLKGMTGAFAGAGVTPEQKAAADRLLSAVGEVAWVEDEALIDAVTAVSGSGPAYFFRLAEALARAGEAQGLAPALAERLARKTLEGAGYLAAASGDHPLATMRANVTSPGGTTAAGLAIFDADGRLDALAANACALHHWTGSPEHNASLRDHAASQKMELTEHGLFRSKSSAKKTSRREAVPCRAEHELFSALGLQDIPPEFARRPG